MRIYAPGPPAPVIKNLRAACGLGRGKEVLLLKKIVINGGRPLHGEITIGGAKNAAVAIIPAAILVDGVCRIDNLPMISDVKVQLEILKEMGASVRLVSRNCVELDCRNLRAESTNLLKKLFCRGMGNNRCDRETVAVARSNVQRLRADGARRAQNSQFTHNIPLYQCSTKV